MAQVYTHDTISIGTSLWSLPLFSVCHTGVISCSRPSLSDVTRVQSEMASIYWCLVEKGGIIYIIIYIYNNCNYTNIYQYHHPIPRTKYQSKHIETMMKVKLLYIFYGSALKMLINCLNIFYTNAAWQSRGSGQQFMMWQAEYCWSRHSVTVTIASKIPAGNAA